MDWAKRWARRIDATQTSSTLGGVGQVTCSKAALPKCPWMKCIFMSAVCYVSLNPVRAGLVARAEDWPWSSVRAHLAGADDPLVTVRPVLGRVASFAKFLLEDREDAFVALRRAEGNGRPLGAEEFVSGLERLLGRPIARRSAGRRPAAKIQGEQLNLLQ